MVIDSKLQQEVAALGDLSRDELAARWIKTYGCSPPSGVRRELLVRAAAWHLQAKTLGGLSPETKRRLAEAARQFGINGSGRAAGSAPETSNEMHGDGKQAVPISKPRRSLSKGARLLRDWNGKIHIVDVTAEGFLFEGKIYRSLSAIARRITGAHWSGPRFFGL
ncbi:MULTISPECIES: DUF2924 domain-containing protein [Mesorhizobium]|uniref:DUF2924 domain-containing protein n=2 Tax=Mesorhizobium TaxID=68287 RepID=A0A1A5IW33_RHILI|nr:MULTISPECIES: DUF2924 domain-containing protein [Mesorhizobium]MBE1707072.1 DUF2924 domain-containing protein [Mesorhizobium japonicum]MBE1716029.1 DUF2924 domain-containing protein [Mesorhizobium japonicum]MUT20707.1 DUF2924 domain-containing protein [Mesorhizobium japonicum]MUT28163.1 DUF2924 domain-containing protein [Mesorhizobium japonicum]OBP80962.1 hypothetical protein BAE42_05020 [Mesorhizobium loti]